MKRLNPSTDLPFKRGDMREDGFVFKQYHTARLKQDGYFVEQWYSEKSNNIIKLQEKQQQKAKYHKSVSTKTGHIKSILSSIKHRCNLKNIPFNLTTEYLESVFTEHCPVFKTSLAWCEHSKTIQQNSPSLDRINPSLGYVMGNVQWLSQKANAMKQDATLQELKLFADWAHRLSL